MTVKIDEEKNPIKVRFPKWFNFALVGFIFAVLLSIGSGFMWAGALSAKVDANIADDYDHHRDPVLHMPFSDKMKTFLSRAEAVVISDQVRSLDDRQREIMTILNRIESKIKSLDK